jgi:hypothetical protein
VTIVVDPTADAPSGITLDRLVARVQSELSDRDNINLLSVDIDADDTVLTTQFSLSAITRGTLLSVEDEVMYVWDTDINAKSITVLRGYANTSPSAHAASTVISAGGKARAQIIDALNDELRSISGKGLYQMKSATLDNYSYATSAYVVDDLAESNVYDVQYLAISETVGWVHMPHWSFSAIDNAITLHCTPASTRLRVLYKSGFAQFVFGSDDIQSDIGLQEEAADVLVWGAAARLAIPEEYFRNDIHTQGDTRRPSEVSAGALMRSAQGFKAMRDERLSEEKDRLRRQFPLRKSGW